MADGLRSPHKGGLQTDDSTSINEVRGWRWLLLWLLALLVRIWGRTLRFKMNAETKTQLNGVPEATAVVLWHNRLFLTPEIFRRHRSRRRIYGLVSASKDGAWLAAFYRLIGIQPVRGSSSNFGREAARQLIEVMRDGHDVGITPDGPRGPIYTVEPGVLVVTRRNHAPMLLIGAEFSRAWRLRSWDRFYVPFPFSRVTLRTEMIAAKSADGSKVSAEEVRAKLLSVNPDEPEN
ncbi:MAG TPA: lysophospholipid acyltransferase family protein [Lacunisphaera sp.]